MSNRSLLPDDDTPRLRFAPDGRWRDVGVMRLQTDSYRDLRASLLGLAYWLETNPENRGLIVLEGSRINDAGLRNESLLKRRVFRPAIASRLSFAVVRDGAYVGLPTDLGEEFRAWLQQLERGKSRKGRAGQSHFEVLKLLTYSWLQDEGPVSTKWLVETSGLSHPTVQRALLSLDEAVRRHSNRQVELRYFPTTEWARLLAAADGARSTTRFTDRSGQPRSPEALVRRLKRNPTDGLAVGGILGARHYEPGLDLVGTPRLDLSYHCPTGTADLSFVETLDPALVKTVRRDEPAALVVHLVRRTASLFQPGQGLQWADPVECLLDLHENRLEPQASEFLDACRASRRRAGGIR